MLVGFCLMKMIGRVCCCCLRETMQRWGNSTSRLASLERNGTHSCGFCVGGRGLRFFLYLFVCLLSNPDNTLSSVAESAIMPEMRGGVLSAAEIWFVVLHRCGSFPGGCSSNCCTFVDRRAPRLKFARKKGFLESAPQLESQMSFCCGVCNARSRGS